MRENEISWKKDTDGTVLSVEATTGVRHPRRIPHYRLSELVESVSAHKTLQSAPIGITPIRVARPGLPIDSNGVTLTGMEQAQQQQAERQRTCEQEADWLSRFHSGQSAAFDCLYQRFAEDVLAMLENRCPTSVSADDLSQEFWVRVWQSRTKFKGGNVRAWLMKIARNLLIDYYRKKFPTLITDEAALPMPEREDNNDLLDALVSCISQCTDPLVETLLAHCNGLSYLEIAERFEVRLGTVGSRIARAKDAVRECIERRLS